MAAPGPADGERLADWLALHSDAIVVIDSDAAEYIFTLAQAGLTLAEAESLGFPS